MFDSIVLRRVAAFVVLFVLYQSAEGLGARVFHSFAVQGALMVACMLAAWPLGRWLGYRGYDAYALRGRAWLPWLVGGLLLAGLAKLAATALGLGLGIFTWQAGGPVSTAGFAPAALAWAALSTFVPSIAEDILARGFWFQASGLRWRAPVFVVASALIFTLNHIYRLSVGPAEWLMLFCFGLAYASAMVHSGSLWPAVGVHWGWNLANALFGDMLPVDVANASASPLLSAGVHLGIAIVVLVLPLAGLRPRANGALPGAWSQPGYRTGQLQSTTSTPRHAMAPRDRTGRAER